MAKEKLKENDALIYILTKNYGLLKCYLRGIFRPQSKNLTLFEPGNLNRFFIITNFKKYQIISALPLKTTTNIFKSQPYLFLWTLRIVKNLGLLETPKFIWFVLTHLENYLRQRSKVFSFWFLFHLLRELGYEVDLENCQKCQRRLRKFAYFDNKRFLYCFYCRQDFYLRISQQELTQARKIKNLIKLPREIPDFLKVLIKNSFNEFLI
ncbi:MAG: hypothetical protein KatS3mg096_028 [Candidatus Parcubacteria bacterium]|nr:MAG: hypothetical protein KatS3mg096_028 [Candidatus Parcubacteria bacterium]